MDSRSIIVCTGCNADIDKCKCIYADIRHLSAQVKRIESHIYNDYMKENHSPEKLMYVEARLLEKNRHIKELRRQHEALQHDYHRLQQEATNSKAVIGELQNRINRLLKSNPSVGSVDYSAKVMRGCQL